MNKKVFVLCSCFFALCALSDLRAQAPAPLTPEALADQWFIRLNDLSTWYISYEGKEDNTAVVDRFVDLYRPDAYHQVGPSEKQIGPVVLYGKDSIRKWADDFSKKYIDLAYRVEYKSRQGQSVEPFYVAKMPWGGAGVAVEFNAVYRKRDDRKLLSMPGTAIFLFDAAGKIDSVRLYMLRDELVQVD